MNAVALSAEAVKESEGEAEAAALRRLNVWNEIQRQRLLSTKAHFGNRTLTSDFQPYLYGLRNEIGKLLIDVEAFGLGLLYSYGDQLW
ncbi:hypothetical protein CBR_g50303 [Chara braunii]|uniref:Uncharacterized protein n=1 Tax=Chara braunii TaxID=69332 RepID=A0A388K5D8_CHABU|nr:hypothetical protein CBR_g50303 [Chara braunii]|eukprot:GBG65261.1 hypothetical protein CBR_g50303 [Chara braunii]